LGSTLIFDKIRAEIHSNSILIAAAKRSKNLAFYPIEFWEIFCKYL
jgi:hypothetical protein